MGNIDLIVDTRIFLKTLSSLFLQCNLIYDKIDIENKTIVIERGNEKLTYPIDEEDKSIILSDALDLCWKKHKNKINK